MQTAEDLPNFATFGSQRSLEKPSLKLTAKAPENWGPAVEAWRFLVETPPFFRGFWLLVFGSVDPWGSCGEFRNLR